MSELHVEIEQTKRLLVKVDIAAYCAAWPKERGEFYGSDEEFVRESIAELAYDWMYHPMDEPGVTIEFDPCHDDIETHILGVVP